ncbi:quinoprotein dehydrogenase-associated SoxYZ-like carrier [Halomonas sp. LR3S48]|uniref:quinoprotein dehydrogenase-associated SoxYZ-like carrier n=1 Tax=Halomonas sp. LR3S48 TaxID=2982694 RepID=UPI0021E4E68E|nr:quinoprotein dehydrogenase-associated SoxYZ-like carrier [Halomonas sp. LR3S48]UYG02787.1 quinoprotein dehydrogenase-associated SoxYZ-like carrier [Halomonas sp. LR3S48]
MTLGRWLCLVLVWASVLAHAEVPDDPFHSPMWRYNLERYLGSDIEVRHDERIDLQVPAFAEDSAQVPLTLDLSRFPHRPRRIVTWVDLNPVPHLFSYDPGELPLRVISLNFRVQQATTVRAAVQDEAGTWHVASAHVDAAGGGCTAPSLTAANPDWERSFGTIHGRAFPRGDHLRYKTHVMHPMDSGMVGNVPAFFIDRVELRGAGETSPLLSLTLSESAAENPMFVFELPQPPSAPLLWMRDNNGNVFERRLEGDAE